MKFDIWQNGNGSGGNIVLSSRHNQIKIGNFVGEQTVKNFSKFFGNVFTGFQ